MADSIDSKNISTTAENKAGIQALLRQGAATIVFTKKDGSERVMKCTLQEGVVVPHEKTTDRVKEQRTTFFLCGTSKLMLGVRSRFQTSRL